MKSPALQLPLLQQQFLAWLQQSDDKIKSAISGESPEQINLRLDIYANSYRLRLMEALSDTFPALHTLVGDERFAQLASDYIDDNPSQHFSLRYFGHHLSSWLESYSLTNEFPVIAEISAFEWSLREAFDAADDSLLTVENLQNIPAQQWESLVFTFHPSVQRIDLLWNTAQLWKVIDEGTEQIEIEKSDCPTGWLVWRKDLKTWFRSMEVDEAWAVDQMMSGENFSTICNGLTEWVDEEFAAQRAVGFMQTWLEQGNLSKLND
jgi:hypothetical protein